MMEEYKPRKPMSEQKKQSVIEQLWLTYYNDTLYAKGLIAEQQRNRMRVMIHTRASERER